MIKQPDLFTRIFRSEKEVDSKKSKIENKPNFNQSLPEKNLNKGKANENQRQSLQNRISIPLSGSKIESYVGCPKKFEFSFVRKVKRDYSISHYLAFDNSLHNSLKAFYKTLSANSNGEKSWLMDLLRKNWDQRGYQSVEHEREYRQIAKSSLEKYFDSHCKQVKSILEIDYFFKTRICGADFSGKIDRIDKNTDGSYELIDYKSGNSPANATEELRKSLSVRLLFLAADQIWPGKVKNISFIYLKENLTVSITRQMIDFEKTRRELQEICKDISRNHFPAKKSMNCSFCDFKGMCTIGKIPEVNPTRLKTFLTCPLKYSMSYVEKATKLTKKEFSPEFILDRPMHETINKFQEIKGFHNSDRIHNDLLQDFLKRLPADIQPDIRESLEKDGSTCIENLLKLWKQNPSKVSVNYALENLESDFFFSTVIDRLEETETSVTLIDFKTGQKTLTTSELRYDPVVSAISQAALKKWPGKDISFKMIFLRSGSSIEIPIEKEMGEYGECLIQELISCQKTQSFCARKGSLCSWCDYFDSCAEWKVKPYEIAGETPDEYSKRLRLSYSKMSLFLNCPRAYKKLYIDRISPRPQPFFSFGTAIHETFEEVYSPTAKRNSISLDELLQIYDRVRKKHRAGYETPEMEENYRLDGVRQLTNYYNNFICGKAFKPAFSIEDYFELPCGKNAVVTGFIDRIDKLEDGTFEIVDYKTEPTMRTQKEIDEDKQLSMYYWACREAFNLDISKLSLIMLDHNVKLETSRSPSIVKDLIETIDGTALQMINEKDFLPKINKYCKSCEHISDCPLRDEIEHDSSLISMQKY